MPLDRTKINRIRRRLDVMFRGRSSPVVLYFGDGTQRTVHGVWHWNVVDDPELPRQVRDIDATVMFRVADVAPVDLQRALYLTPAGWEGAGVSGVVGRFLVSDILPKGTAWPPDRLVCHLRRGA